MTFSARLYRWLLRVLPTDFRGDFGDAMLADLEFAGAQPASFWRREIGGLLRAVVREHIDALQQDLKYALRMIARTPGFTAIAVIMLALGTGVNVAMFSVVDAVLLNSPFRNPQQLVLVDAIVDGKTTPAVPIERYRALEAHHPQFTSIGMFDLGTHVLTRNGERQRVRFECVSASIFDVLGTAPLIGRTFSASDDRAGEHPTAVISHRFWRQLGGDESVLGSAITLNGRAVTVVGVMPPRFAGPRDSTAADGWVPIANTIAGDGQRGCRISNSVEVFGRLYPSLTTASAANTIPGFVVRSLTAQSVSEYRTPFIALSVALICIVLIVCANVGGLQLERTAARRQEFAARLAMGASWHRLWRQILTEQIVLAVIGAAAGTVLATLTMPALITLLPQQMAGLAQISVNQRALLFAIGFACVSAALCAVSPLIGARRALSSTTANTRGMSRDGQRFRQALVIVQVTASFAVMAAAGLMIRTFMTLRLVDTGFAIEHRLVAAVEASDGAPLSFDEAARSIERIPGVQAAAGTTDALMSGVTTSTNVSTDDGAVRAIKYAVTPSFFDVMQMSMRTGRVFETRDASGAEPVAIVNEALALRLDPSGHALGRTIAASGFKTPLRIVGIVANVRASGNSTRSQMEIYLPWSQFPSGRMTLMIAASADDKHTLQQVGASLRAALPNAFRKPVVTMTELLEPRLANRRLGAWLLGAFAALAGLLTCIGLATAMSWWVRQRTRELSIRLALGATPARIARNTALRGAALCGLGLLGGVTAAAMITRTLREWIYGVEPLDPITFAAAALIMIVFSLFAAYLPARRASRIDPAITLRTE